MNENINLCEILKGHEGETFYSPIRGNAVLIKATEHVITVKHTPNSHKSNELLFYDMTQQECCEEINKYAI